MTRNYVYVSTSNVCACRNPVYVLLMPSQLRPRLIAPRLHLNLYLYHPLAPAPAQDWPSRRLVQVHEHEENKDKDKEREEEPYLGLLEALQPSNFLSVNRPSPKRTHPRYSGCLHYAG